ncbi:hypothetical protein [Streptomyces sp. KMM 9044]|uniref:hypothetical protein n=1 Tax=Streptomyces sp. KMM 9044 TaxID=2744474 RepID=UPI00215096D6|nr:hypothetical protein [Streptomyces sp. KMM 9044]WAX80202.1 hypothetical protein HUV60_023630 [Streptomyces sp. KMM 9044]
MSEIALEALGAGPPVATAGTYRTAEPTVADVWTERHLGFVLLYHRRDDGYFAEELYYSLRGSDDGAEEGWAACDHLSGGLLGFDPEDASSREEVLAGNAMAIVTESESMVYTGRLAENEGDELLRVVELLVSAEADVLEIENLTRPSHYRRSLPSALALLVLLPGDRIRVRAARSTRSGCIPVGDVIELSHSPNSATRSGWL